MTDKEIRKLSRAELLEMMIEQSKELEQTRSQLAEANKKLEDRRICLDQAGTIAEAAFQLNGVFDAAQAAAQQYLENIRGLSERQEQICAEMEKNTRLKCEAMEKETADKCEAMRLEAQKDVEERWSEISARLENFYEAHRGLKELLALTGGVQLDKNEQ